MCAWMCSLGCGVVRPGGCWWVGGWWRRRTRHRNSASRLHTRGSAVRLLGQCTAGPGFGSGVPLVPGGGVWFSFWVVCAPKPDGPPPVGRSADAAAGRAGSRGRAVGGFGFLWVGHVARVGGDRGPWPVPCPLTAEECSGGVSVPRLLQRVGPCGGWGFPAGRVRATHCVPGGTDVCVGLSRRGFWRILGLPEVFAGIGAAERAGCSTSGSCPSPLLGSVLRDS